MNSYALKSMFKNVSNAVKQVALNLSELELKVEEATNSEPWGPSGSLMTEIAEAAYNTDDYKQIMGVLARRLADYENWRHIYKALLLLEYLVKNGPVKTVAEVRNSIHILEKLQNFEFKEKGKDQGINVRNRAKELANLVNDDDRVKQEREKAVQLKSKYRGVSSEDAKFGLGGTSTLNQDYNFYKKEKNINKNSETNDPVQATQDRIIALKFNDLKFNEDAFGDPIIETQKINTEDTSSNNTPKKLSNVKVNPTIAASIQGFAGGANTPSTPSKQGAGDLLFDDTPSGGPPQSNSKSDFDPFSDFAGQGTMTQNTVQQTQQADPFFSQDIVQQQAQDPFGDMAAAPTPSQPVQQSTNDLIDSLYVPSPQNNNAQNVQNVTNSSGFDSLYVPTQNNVNFSTQNNNSVDPFENFAGTSQNVNFGNVQNAQNVDPFQNFENVQNVTQNVDPFQTMGAMNPSADPFSNGGADEWVEAVPVGAKQGGKMMTGQKGPAAQKAAAAQAKLKNDPFADLDILKK